MIDPRDAPAPHRRAASMWRRYLRFWGPGAAADVDDELRYHIEMRVRDYMARGLTDDEARAATARRLGDLMAARSTCVAITARRERRMTRAQLLDAFLQDVRFAFRTLGRQKGWTAVGVLTLALGIGANAAVFSVVNNLILHPLPYPSSDRLAVVYEQPTTGNNTGISVKIMPQPAALKTWREGARSFESVEGFVTNEMIFEPANATPVMLETASVLPTFLRFAGQQPLIGRGFTDDDIASGGKVALISEGLWRTRYGADTAILGRSMTLGGSNHRIIGVMPARFRMPAVLQDRTDLWLPLDLRAPNMGMSIVGRLRPGATYASAARELDSLVAREAAVSGGRTNSDFATVVVPPRELVRFHDSLILLSAVVAMVLIIACANVAHLLLARGAARQREIAIRATLGAGAGRLFRQLITESLVLALAGCAGGLIVGWAGLHALLALRPASLDQLNAAKLDGTTLLVTIGVSVVTGVVFGLVGAFQSSRLATHDALKSGSLNASGSKASGRLRSLLVVTEMALSMTLLVGATLLIRSIVHLQMIDPGFRAAGLYVMRPTLPSTSYATRADKRRYYDEMVRAARSVRGVEAVTLASAAPPSRSFKIGGLEIEGEAPPAPGTTSFVNSNEVESDFFRVMGMRLMEGTTFTDTTEAAGQIIVNEGLARAHWPGKSALGHRLRVVYAGQGAWKTIVGVAANASTGGLLMETTAPMLYYPRSETSNFAAIVRVNDPTRALPALRAIGIRIDPRLPAPEVTSVERSLSNSIATQRFTMTLLAIFTALALVLAAVGLYGVMSYAVAQRTREIGIRIALGATRRNIARAIVLQGLFLGVVGMAIGLVASRWATKLVAGMLSGVTALDPASFAIAAVVLMATAVAACVVPMTRAVAVDPLIAMKAE